jgi:DNA-binding transcriptional LysR family regulator
VNWEDLRYILAVSREGTLQDGAKALRVNPTTMSRRLKAMEEDVGTALFEKLKHGAVLTDAGEEVVAVAAEVERMTHELDARIHGRDARLEGTVRATFSDMALAHWIGDFAAFKEENPGIELELTASTEISNLTQREADVAVRLALKVPEHLVGNRYAEFHFALFGSEALVDEVGADAPYADYPFVGWDLPGGRGAEDWRLKNAPGADVVLRVNTMPIMARALEAGLGIAVLPCFIGDANPRLRRVGDHLTGGLHLWVLTHPQLRGAARIRAFTRFMRGLIARDKDLIEGRAPRV